MSEFYGDSEENVKSVPNSASNGKELDVDIVLERSVEVAPSTSSTSSTSVTLQNVVNTVVSRLGGREVSPQTLMVVVKYAMEVVELTKLKGSEQRQMVVDVVKQVVVDAPISDEREKLCLDMIESGVLGQTVDLVVDASKGHLDINRVVSLAENCCFSFLGSRRRRRQQSHE